MHCCASANDEAVEIHGEQLLGQLRHEEEQLPTLQMQLTASREEHGELKRAFAALQSEVEAQKKILGMLTEKVENLHGPSLKILVEDADLGKEQKESQEVLPEGCVPPLASRDCKIEEIPRTPSTVDSSVFPMRQYALEENLYGYVIAVPSRWIFHILTLIIYYTLVIGISYVITLGVANTWSSSMNDLNDTCKRDGDAWDCRPPDFTVLQDFAALDTNGDGMWSVVEARAARMLGHFRGLHEMALVTPKFLNMIMPFKEAEINLFCYLFWVSPNPLSLLDPSELVEMAEVSGYLTGDIRSSCADVPTDLDRFHCYFRSLCPSFDPYSSSNMQEASPAQSSTEQYMEATTHLTEISHSLHGSLLRNLVRPCRIVDPDLCSNVEVGGMLKTIPMWERLNPEDRVKECEVYVRSSCPQLFGNEYNRFQLGLRQTCGEASYSPGELDAPPALESFIRMSNPTCEDNQTLGRIYVKRLWGANPIMLFLLRGVERMENLPEGYLVSNLTCGIGASLNFCSDTSGLVNPDDNVSFVSTASLFGQACPASCCQLNSYACPSPCVAWTEKTDASFGSLTCTGSACNHIYIGGQASAITLKKEGYDYREAARLVIQSNLSLQMYIRSMQVGDSLDPFCTDGYVEVDKVRYCSGNAPERVEIPRRVGGLVELVWQTESPCYDPECGWSLLIVEAGEPESYTVSVVSYENVKKFYDDQTGVVTLIYRFFFTLVLFIWTGYIMMEFKDAWGYMECVWHHPAFARGLKFAVVVGVCLPRLAIALWVFVVGVVLLITSTSYVDIVLNSVALAFLLDIDEYLFTIALTGRDREKVMNADVIRWPCTSQFLILIGKFGALKIYLCLLLAVVVSFLQYTSFIHVGYNLESVGFRCACALSGDTCSDAILDA